MSSTFGNEYARRRQRAVEAMRAARIDGILLTPGADLYYLTGFHHTHAGERLLGFLLDANGRGRWLCPAMNEAQVREALQPGQELIAWTDARGYRAPLTDLLPGMGRVAFDEEARAGFLLDLLAAAPAAEVLPSSLLMRRLRLCKGAEELAHLRAAAAVVDGAIPDALALCRPGATELQVEAGLRDLLSARPGCEGVAFTIVAGGPNSALPHHETGDRPLQAGDVVVLDFGTKHGGYHSDITVTATLSEPADADVRRVYRTVWEAQQRALEAIRPGVACGAIDAAARSVIGAAGWGPHFLHRTGHGLGLQVHEPPYLVSGSEEPLEEGMVFSVEPGIYLPGRFGVRLEVIAAVGPDGVDLINRPSAPELPSAG